MILSFIETYSVKLNILSYCILLIFFYIYLDLTTADALTAKTFQEINETIANFRFNEYLRLKALYYAYSAHKNIETVPFSKFDDEKGFNEFAAPTPESLIDIFNQYVDEKSEYMDNFQENIKINSVLSVDATFNIQKKTLVY